MAATMKLYVTYTSPYARLARILVLEKALEDRVDVIAAKTRVANSLYYEINPSGRAPYLIHDSGVGMEDSQLICAYLDSLDGKPRFHDGASLNACLRLGPDPRRALEPAAHPPHQQAGRVTAPDQCCSHVRKFCQGANGMDPALPAGRNVGRGLQRGRFIMQVVRIGLDLAKYVFEVHGVDGQGNVVIRKTLRRGSVSTFFANLPPCLVGMEASNGAHYWARLLTELGHKVRLISPQFVAPYVKTNKNDRNDAEAICEAVSRPTMRNRAGSIYVHT
jgi:hypothetical protein